IWGCRDDLSALAGKATELRLWLWEPPHLCPSPFVPITWL
ncbi:hypothetical protein AK812_SmicGene46623, partial [Symbiodinium microadriaticum]